MTTFSYDALRDFDARHVWHPFTQAGTAAPAVLALGGRGAFIYDAEGKSYLDLVSSWWVNLHGHAHPAIARAIAEQASRLEQVIFADFTHEPAARLAARVTERLPGDLDRVFFSDDGSTAVEVALKMARQYWSNLGQDRPVFIAFEGAYHGDTVGAMSAGRTSGYFQAWESLLFPVEIAPFPATWEGDEQVEDKERQALHALDRLLEQHQGKVAGVITEPLIQGACGMRMCRPAFLQQVAERVHAAGTLLILDEVMTGFGRTGAIFACVKAGIMPDMVCLSKGLTGGFLPMALTVTTERIYQAFLGQDLSRAFLHGHSFTANPLGCAAALASLDLLEDPACQARIQTIETLHRQHLPVLAERFRLSRPRLCGTIAAFDLPQPGLGPWLKQAFREHGILMRPLGSVVYLLPPYCIEPSDLHRAWEVVEIILTQLGSQNPARMSPFTEERAP